MSLKSFGLFGSLGLCLVLSTGPTTVVADQHTVSFKKDVQPILAASCLECHSKDGKGQQKSGLLLDSYEHIMKGTKYGPIVVPGSSLNSVFNQVVEGRVDKSISMPHGGKPMSEASIKILKDWVDQGAKNN